MAPPNANGSGSLNVISAIAGVAMAVAGGVYFAEDHYLTHSTGVPRTVAEEQLATKSELVAAQNATNGYLLDLRIEQAMSRQRDLEDRSRSRPLDTNEQRRLNETDAELQRLYQLKERQR